MGDAQNLVALDFVALPIDDMRRAAREYAQLLHRRRTVREFDSRAVPRDIIERFGIDAAGAKQKRYYPDESVGIATGMLISALHVAGLTTLTHTPSPMKFLNEILGRPKDIERPFLLLVVGYPAPNCRIPDINRLPFEQIVSWVVPSRS
jgi:nitroreductase